jgi:hypothetical protein
MIGEHH